MTITGTEYYRRLNRMRQKDLAKAAGVDHATVHRILHNENPDTMYLHNYVRLSDALGVTIDDLLTSHDASELDGTGYIPPGDSNDLHNPIAVYRREKSLTLKVLGERLGGLTTERVRKICLADQPPEKHLRTLAIYEGITDEQFRRRYAVPTQQGSGTKARRQSQEELEGD